MQARLLLGLFLCSILPLLAHSSTSTYFPTPFYLLFCSQPPLTSSSPTPPVVVTNGQIISNVLLTAATGDIVSVAPGPYLGELARTITANITIVYGTVSLLIRLVHFF